MHFKVTAADAKTGKEKTIGLSADSRAEVEAWAQKQGLMVLSMIEDGPVPMAKPARITDPHNITGNANILKTVGGLLITLGIVGIVAGVGTALALQLPGLPLAIYAGGLGVISLGIGAALRMLAAIGLTLRDYVRR